MDGSADLKWRLYQSRRGTQAAASPLGRGRNKADGRMLPGFSSGAAASLRYNSNIPYSSWTQPTDIRVPRWVPLLASLENIDHHLVSVCSHLQQLCP